MPTRETMEHISTENKDFCLEEINKLRKEKSAIILAHNYTRPEIQDIADFVGDSLELSREAAESNAPVIVFCGVRFMAETAKILNPLAQVLLPNQDAGCPMADMVSKEDLEKYKARHPNTPIIAYVNTTAETKTMVDLCVTSGNAEAIIRGRPQYKGALFVPDQNLGTNLNNVIDSDLELWPGCCPTHNKIFPHHINDAKIAHPNAMVLVHPECSPAVVELADRALSTGAMLKFVKSSPVQEFIIGTESGIIHRMQRENPDKIFHTLDPEPVCPNMKRILLGDVMLALKYPDDSEIRLDANLIIEARRPIRTMLELSK